MRSQLALCARFYLGLGAPCARTSYPECSVRAANGYAPDLVRELLALRRGGSTAGTVQEVNHRCRVITPEGSDTSFFFKDFPRSHRLHELERIVRCSRVDRAWRAAHLLPSLGFLTPAPVGTALSVMGGEPVEYLVTEWLADAIPYHVRLRAVTQADQRAQMLREFAAHLRRQHDHRIYLRDLVTNMLTRESQGEIEYWLTDLDQLHPYKHITRRRLMHQMRQLARWTGPLTEWEAEMIAMAYLRRPSESAMETITRTLQETPPAER